jgi:4-alpha-glucanotransferase
MEAFTMRLPRASGLLLHPTSLPSPFGIGDLGPSAFEFIEALAESGQRWWQMLPLGPTGYGNSPYQSYSSYAGNPLLVSLEVLRDEGLLSPSDWADLPELPEDHVDFEAVIPLKTALLRRAFAHAKPMPEAFGAFVSEHAHWLDDFALFMALKETHGGAAWTDWETSLVARDPGALATAREKLEESVRFYQFVQYVLGRQWSALKAACARHQIGLIGDLPIFVALDSADVWARPDLFWLDDHGQPTFVAGVPPDYFAATGQLWGNPLYRWEAHAAEGFAWWIARLKAQTDRVDLVRLDHFRGFEAYWEIPAGSPVAATGRWAKGPGTAFLEAVRDGLGDLPIVAEDLGEITAEVYALRDRFELPGMRVLQFGFSGERGTDFHLPYSYVPHCIAYTGTHDNDTTVGWFTDPPRGTAAERAEVLAERSWARKLVGAKGDEIHWDVIRAAFESVADTVIVPLQDVLGLGSSARMNVPGRPDGNWRWRTRPGQFRPQSRDRLAELTAVAGRWNGTPPPRFGPPYLLRVSIDTPEKETTPAPSPAPATATTARDSTSAATPSRPAPKRKARAKRRPS